jgi:2-polyprenyl-6-methoxyphenol hydroxylase-like FAD-dependent oxidoreductase
VINLGRCYDETAAVLAMETLTSPSPTATYLPTLDHRANELSPAPRAFLTQHILLRILRRRANSLPLITLRYNCPVVSLAQHERRVIAQTSYGKIVAHYCVGCDGSSGTTRKLVTGEKRSGRGLLTKSMTIVFRVCSAETFLTYRLI